MSIGKDIKFRTRPEPNKPNNVYRVNVATTHSFMSANRYADFLKENGCDVKVITKHAVQVHPKDIPRMKELHESYLRLYDNNPDQGPSGQAENSGKTSG